MSSRDLGHIVGARKLTPMLKQYVQAKSDAPDAILFFRMGDFYELFFDDARVAARELDLTLTARDKGPDAIPMAGVPHHTLDGYVARLVEKGFSVAICDQVEDPKVARGLVRREITQMITPGTTTDLESLDPASASYLACVSRDTAHSVSGASGLEETFVLALLDLLAGEILCTTVRGTTGLADELRRMAVREVLTPPSDLESVQDDPLPGMLRRLELKAVILRSFPDAEAADVTLMAHFGEQQFGEQQFGEQQFGEQQFGEQQFGGSDLPRSAGLLRQTVAAIIAYAEATQRRSLKHFMRPRIYRSSDYMMVDETTRRNLELLRRQVDGNKTGSLCWHLDRCATSLGSRRLAQWLLFPQRRRPAIEERLDAVAALVQERPLRHDLREALAGVRDVERLVGRVAVGRATPRDLGALRGSLIGVAAVRCLLSEHPSPLGARWGSVDDLGDLRQHLEAALVDTPPTVTNEGNIFRRGFCTDLDELIALASEGQMFVTNLEQRERKRTGISSLKVRYNKVFGYYIEVTRANLAQIPSDYVRKQTLVSAERFVTEELKAFEDQVLSADERQKAREMEMFAALLDVVAGHAKRLRNLARHISETDALMSLAEVADEGRYVRPTLSDDAVLSLQAARHPVLERLMPGGEPFVPNDVILSSHERQLSIVTGPNMAGKSTVMRQTALCALLAHMGSFVPAKTALVGICDRLFTRVGAADDLGRGRSTFMVEMEETATILREATAQSLVLLDEIGRGTSTFDGVSIAWAVAEHLHDHVRCRAMFATHYHELTDLARERPRIVNMSVAVKEHEGNVVFLRQLLDEPANRSYGIAVARLAGLPSEVLNRAREILTNLERGEFDEGGMPTISHGKATSDSTGGNGGKGDGKRQQRALFTAPPRLSAVDKRIAQIDPLQLTPLQALTLLVELKELAKSTKNSASARKSGHLP